MITKVKTNSIKKSIKKTPKSVATPTKKCNLVKNSLLGALGLSVVGAGLLGINKVKRETKLKELTNNDNYEKLIKTLNEQQASINKLQKNEIENLQKIENLEKLNNEIKEKFNINFAHIAHDLFNEKYKPKDYQKIKFLY
jgi:uncharacterized protein HemX